MLLAKKRRINVKFISYQLPLHLKALNNFTMSDKLTNLNYLNELAEGDTDFVKDMIETFIENTPELIDQMKSELSNSEYLAVGQTAHKIKPTITFMGISSLEELIREIEHKGKNSEDIDSIPSLVQKLENTCNLAYDELKVALETI